MRKARGPGRINACDGTQQLARALVLFRIFEQRRTAPAALIQSSIQTETHKVVKSSRICKEISAFTQRLEHVGTGSDFAGPMAVEMEPALMYGCAALWLSASQHSGTFWILRRGEQAVFTYMILAGDRTQPPRHKSAPQICCGVET
jgi:hypothetical protein